MISAWRKYRYHAKKGEWRKIMRSRLFQYVLVQVPKDEKQKESILSSAVTLVIAKDETEARMKAAKNIPEGLDLDEVEIVMRPF